MATIGDVAGGITTGGGTPGGGTTPTGGIPPTGGAPTDAGTVSKSATYIKSVIPPAPHNAANSAAPAAAAGAVHISVNVACAPAVATSGAGTPPFMKAPVFVEKRYPRGKVEETVTEYVVPGTNPVAGMFVVIMQLAPVGAGSNPEKSGIVRGGVTIAAGVPGT